MRTFRDYFNIEAHRFVRPLNLILALLFLAAALTFIHNSTSQYKKFLESKEKFKTIEQQKVEKYVSYTQYGGAGFRVLFVPSPLSIFFANSGLFKELTASLNVEERLNIDVSLKGQGMFKEKTFPYGDFFGLFLLFGTLLLLLYGYESFLHKDYLELLAGVMGKNRVYSHVFLSRYIIISLYFLGVIGLGIILALLKGIVFSRADYLMVLVLAAVWLLVSLLMFALGAIIGRIPNKSTAIVALLLSWIFLIYFSPLVISNLISNKSTYIPPNYQCDLNKLTELWNFEKMAKEILGRFSRDKKNSNKAKETIENFISRGYQNIKGIEKYLENQTSVTIQFAQKIAMVVPTTFLYSLNCELSSKGYGSISAFHQYVQDLKHRFCMFYKEKKFYTDEEKPENFIKGEENIYYARPRLPHYFVQGILLYGLSALVMVLLVFFLFRVSIFRIRVKKQPQNQPEPLVFKSGQSRVLKVEGRFFKDYLYNLFTGNIAQIEKSRYHFPGKIVLDDEEITAAANKRGVFYLPPPASIPGDIRIDSFLLFFAGIGGLKRKDRRELYKRLGVEGIWTRRFNQLEELEGFRVLLSVLSLVESSLYLLYDVTRQMPLEAAFLLRDRMEELEKGGALVLFLTTAHTVTNNQTIKNYHFWEVSRWFSQVDQLRETMKKWEEE